jgi:hypothetical protein
MWSPEGGLERQLRDLLDLKRAIDAVRLYRDSTGAGLSEAKAYIDTAREAALGHDPFAEPDLTVLAAPAR